MEINCGDKIAIVGYNGAGKTTLIKLLMRLYDVDEGEILWNGINIKEYDLPGYRHISVQCFRTTKYSPLQLPKTYWATHTMAVKKRAPRSCLLYTKRHSTTSWLNLSRRITVLTRSSREN